MLFCPERYHDNFKEIIIRLLVASFILLSLIIINSDIFLHILIRCSVSFLWWFGVKPP